MKTTLNISEPVMRRLKEEAARQGKTMSEMVEAALRGLLDRRPNEMSLPPLPTFDSGFARVNIADRKALYEAMEKHDGRHGY